jgi:phospholipase C
MARRRRSLLTAATRLAVAVAAIAALCAARATPPARAAATPIEHLVVVFDENVSFDHYFGTYPAAANPPGEPAFSPAAGTPTPDGLTAALLTANPNGANPQRLTRAQAVTCDQDHDYTNQQKAFHGGAMDLFLAGGVCADKSLVLDYYDGNTVTALWNVAQRFAMSDANFGSTFGPSTPGALNLVAGTTHGAAAGPGVVSGSVIADPFPLGDDCGPGTARLTGTNIGDLMTAAGMTWGWFQGGFRPTASSGGVAVCGSTHTNVAGGVAPDYRAHHEPFQYFASTSNPHHLPPSSTATIGHDDQANHQYDLADFDAALAAGSLPQVSFLKAAGFEDGHPGYSGPLDEQRWLARVLDLVQQSPAWSTTAVIVTYDDSDGWYDHAFHAPTQGSRTAADALDGPGVCGPLPAPGDYHGRCSPGPRLPLLVVSPWARSNAVDSTFTTQASIIRFVEDNWLGGARIGDQSFDATAGTLTNLFDFDPGHARTPKLFLSPSDGTVLGGPPAGLAVTPAPDPAPPPPPPPPPVAPPPPAPPPPPPPAAPASKPLKLTVTATRKGRTVTLSLRVANLAKPDTTAGVTLKKGTRTIASRKRARLRSGRVKLTLLARKKVVKGRYKVTVTVTQAGRKRILTATLKLR